MVLNVDNDGSVCLGPRSRYGTAVLTLESISSRVSVGLQVLRTLKV